MNIRRHLPLFIFPLLFFADAYPEPVVITGAMVPELLGSQVADVRMVNGRGEPIPFQVDEITPGGEYVCESGENPNADSANRVLDRQDEIVFMREDADSLQQEFFRQPPAGVKRACVTVGSGAQARRAWIICDRSLPLSTVRYLVYDHEKQLLRTPWYYARFGRDRFHFTCAGCMDFSRGAFVDLTRELRIELTLKMLWGLLPIRYTEESIICKVKRYKAGPVRLIRRGDFHLNVGLGLKAGRAVVYQLCYPQMVNVPVRITLPLRFGSLFSDAYMEMTPVLRPEAGGYRFMVPAAGFERMVGGSGAMDTIIKMVPDKGYLVSDGSRGFGWITRMKADTGLLAGSGYLFRRPSKRKGIAECGFRLSVSDLPKGNYNIVNWVFFSKQPLEKTAVPILSVLDPAVITVSGKSFKNALIGPNN